MQRSKSTLLLTLLAIFGVRQASAVGCELVTSVKNAGAAAAENEVGFIFVPGATVPGQQYAPLVAAILADYPGNAWGAVTRDWDNDFPNPLGMEEAVQACYDLVCSHLIYSLKKSQGYYMPPKYGH